MFGIICQIATDLKWDDSNLVDAVGLDGRVDQFSYEFASHILFFLLRQRTIPMRKKAIELSTSLKNFLAPDFKAFLSAASKSCCTDVS